jgi:hypothetical protein
MLSVELMKTVSRNFKLLGKKIKRTVILFPSSDFCFVQNLPERKDVSVFGENDDILLPFVH